VKQPFLGLAASAIGIVLALSFVAMLPVPSFLGPVAFYLLCTIPFQVMVVVVWAANPSFVATLPQPARGLVLLIVTLIAGAIIAPIALGAVGEGTSPPGPIPSHFAVIVVPMTFWLAIMWGGWPFNLLSSDIKVAGSALLGGAYLVAWIVFRVFFDYMFMQGAPVYLTSAPHGMFDAVSALVFIVTALAAMFLLLCFDLWPFTLAPPVMQQPALGLVWTLVALLIAWLAMFVGVTAMGTDPMAFLVSVTVPFIFGSIIVLNMFQNSLAGRMAQPSRGIVNTLLVIVIGQALAMLYRVAAPPLAGPLAQGPPTYELEVWLANALLSVTFPCLIFLATYFGFWPLTRRS
jgi:hypothetical protein